MRISDWSSDVCSSDLVGRMAVLRDWRGGGVGDALLHALLRQARELGWNDIILNAQVSAQSFYARHGFVPVGERFIEAGIEHQAMRRRIEIGRAAGRERVCQYV